MPYGDENKPRKPLWWNPGPLGTPVPGAENAGPVRTPMTFEPGWCEHCGQTVQQFNHLHLRYVHRYVGPDPMAAYRLRFGMMRAGELRKGGLTATEMLQLSRLADRPVRVADRPEPWNKERAEAFVHERVAEKGPLNLASVPPALRRFVFRRLKMEWSAFVRGMGIPFVDPKSGVDWSKKEVIARIRKRQRKKQGLLMVEVKRDDPALARFALRFCGTWDEALEAAGVNIVKLRAAARLARRAALPTASPRGRATPKPKPARRR